MKDLIIFWGGNVLPRENFGLRIRSPHSVSNEGHGRCPSRRETELEDAKTCSPLLPPEGMQPPAP